MKNTTVYFLTTIFIVAFLLTNSCSQKWYEDGSLDEVKAFRPDDKYFKSGLKSLHYIIETSENEQSKKSFQRIVDTYKLPLTTDNIADGTYTGESPYDAFDYKHVVTLTVKDKNIVEVDYNEVHKNGSDKESDKKYNKDMSIVGTSPAIAYPDMEKQLLEKQEMMQVDAVSGATASLYRFRYAILMAFMKARIAEMK